MQAVLRRQISQRFVHDVVARDSAIKSREAFVSQGPGGRLSVSGHVATVFGATGFLGRYVVNALAKQGTQVITPYRGTDDDRRHLKLMGDLGQIVQMRFDLRNEEQLVQCIRHSDVVYNLMGQNYETKNFTFDQIHVDSAVKIARLCRELGVSKLVHTSALNANRASSSGFLRSKMTGEQRVREEYPDAIIVRPGTMYGHEDRFYNRLFAFARLGYIPVPGHGYTKVRPVYVADVAHAMANLLHREDLTGATLEFAGPKEYTWEYIANFFNAVTQRDAAIRHLPKPVFKYLLAYVRALGYAYNWTQFLPTITQDEVERLFVSDELTNVPGLAELGINPATMEDTIAKFLKSYIPARFQRVPLEEIINKNIRDSY